MRRLTGLHAATCKSKGFFTSSCKEKELMNCGNFSIKCSFKKVWLKIVCVSLEKKKVKIGSNAALRGEKRRKIAIKYKILFLIMQIAFANECSLKWDNFMEIEDIDGIEWFVDDVVLVDFEMKIVL